VTCTKIPKWQLNVLLLEVISVMSGTNNILDFSYNNGNKGRVIIVLQVKNQERFHKSVHKTHNWLKSMLLNLAGGEDCNKNNTADWVSYYLGKKHDGAFTLASESLGLPIMHLLDAAGALAMWWDANINYTYYSILSNDIFSIILGNGC
jgi:hypothetical protein